MTEEKLKYDELVDKEIGKMNREERNKISFMKKYFREPEKKL